MTPILLPATYGCKTFRRWFCLALWLACSGAVLAGEDNPLEPVDTASPRTTLEGFMKVMNDAYALGYGRVQNYLGSSRLFLSAEDVEVILSGMRRLEAAERTIDFSGLPPATVHESSRRLTLQLKDILDRLPLPPPEAIPDAQAMAAAEFKRWTVPGTEIRIARVETGPRAGEYLFSAETASRLPEFFYKARGIPYRAGASLGLFEFSTRSPAGVAIALYRVMPSRWLLQLPPWAMTQAFGQPVWRWLGIAQVLGGGLGWVALAHRLSGRWADPEGAEGQWAILLRPASLVLAAPLAARLLDDVLRVSGGTGKVLTLSLWTLFYLALTTLVWRAGTAIAESVIRSEKLRVSSIDSQLIRLMLRLLTIVAAIAILVIGADRVGLPAYSVVAGLGVGGLAVALAGQQTLANLLGSLIIMFEKPFSIGDQIKVNDTEGTVEDVGFRSTRIRTFYDSLVTIPSSQMANSLIDNLERREHREVRTVLNLTYDTPAEEVQGFVGGVRQILENHPDTRKDNLQVRFFDFGPHSLDILVKFLIKAPNRLAGLAEREGIMLDILRLAKAHGVKLAYPTQSL